MSHPENTWQVPEEEWRAMERDHVETMIAERTLSCGTEVTLRKNGSIEIAERVVNADEMMQFMREAMETSR